MRTVKGQVAVAVTVLIMIDIVEVEIPQVESGSGPKWLMRLILKLDQPKKPKTNQKKEISKRAVHHYQIMQNSFITL